MDNESYSFGGFGFMAIFLLILFAMWGGNGFWGNRGNGNAGAFLAGDVVGSLGNGFNSNSNIAQIALENRLSQVKDTATTQHLIEDRTAKVTQELSNKIDFYHYEDMKEKLTEAKMRNIQLEGIIADNQRYNALQGELASIRCNMLTKPVVHGIGYVCDGTQVPAVKTTTGTTTA